MIRSSKKARARRSLVIKLDALARQRCFARDQHLCVRCHSAKVQWAHIISRRHLCTRWELDNCLALCYTCHAWWHSYPSLSGPWFAKNWPERHSRITGLFNAGGKVDLKRLLSDLQDADMPPGRMMAQPIADAEIPF